MEEMAPSLLLFFFGADTMLKQEAGQKPPGPIVQADQPIYIESGVAVIPGAHIHFAQKPAGGVFGGKDQDHVDETTDQDIAFAENLVDGSNGCRHTVDGKHQK